MGDKIKTNSLNSTNSYGFTKDFLQEGFPINVYW